MQVSFAPQVCARDDIDDRGWHAKELFAVLLRGASATGVATAVITAHLIDAVGRARCNTDAFGADRTDAAVVINLAFLARVDGAVAAQTRGFASTIYALLPIPAVSAGAIATIVATALVDAVGVAWANTEAVDALLLVAAIATVPTAAIIATIEAVARGNTVNTLAGVTDLLCFAAAILGAGLTVFIGIASQIATEGVWCGAAITTIHTGIGAEVIPHGVATVGVHLADTFLTGAAATPRSFHRLATDRGTHAILADEPFRALATLTTTAIGTAILAVARWHADHTLTAYALLAVTARRVAGGALHGVFAAGVAAQVDQFRRSAVVTRREGLIANIPSAHAILDGATIKC